MHFNFNHSTNSHTKPTTATAAANTATTTATATNTAAATNNAAATHGTSTEITFHILPRNITIIMMNIIMSVKRKLTAWE